MSGGKTVRERFCLLITLLILVTTGTLVTAHHDGIHGEFVKNGCACHGSAPSNDVTVTIEGLPSVYNASQNYSLSVTITGGPEAGGVNHGGFNLRVGGGTLSKNTDDNAIQIAQQSMEATHTSTGTQQYSWNLTWTAPDSDVFLIEVRAYGNAVNGDESPAGDMWSGSTINVPGQNWTETIEEEGVTDTLIFVAMIVALVSAPVSLVYFILRRPDREG